MERKGKLSGSSGLSGSLSGGSAVGGSLSLPDARAGDYEKLKNLPKINDIEVIGNKSFDDLGMTEVTNIDIDNLFKQIF